MNRAGAAGFASSIIVMAWTGIYLSRHPIRASPAIRDVRAKNLTNSTRYEIVPETVYLPTVNPGKNLTTSELRQVKVKEVETIIRFLVLATSETKTMVFLFCR